jgi:pilus assembly protein Flp/PilA
MSKLRNWAVTKVVSLQSRRDEEGQGLAEYGLILALIAVVCIGALTALGTGISGALQAIVAELP